MFFILNYAKSLIEPQCSAAQSSSMTHPYKWAIADVLYGKNIVDRVDSSCNQLWKSHGTLFDIIAVRKLFKKIRKLRFSHFCAFFLYCVCFPADPNRLSLWSFHLRLCFFKRSNNSIVPNKQLWNSKMDGIIVTSKIKLANIIFVILSGHWEHYPNRANHATFLVNSMSIEMSSTTNLPPWLHLGWKLWPSHTPCKK